MMSNADIREFILEPAMKDIGQRLRSVQVVFDTGPIENRDFHLMRIYFPGPEKFDENLIEDLEVARAISYKLYETLYEWHQTESGGRNQIISAIGISEEFYIVESPNDWEAMAGDVPPGQVPYCLHLWIGAASWPEVEIAFD